MAIINVLPLNVKFTLQYILCDNEHNFFKNVSFISEHNIKLFQ